MKLLVGLGNVGSQYAKTRHNIGFMILDHLAAAHSATWRLEAKLKAEVATIELATETTATDTPQAPHPKILLAKPQTMMNLSGEAIQRLVQYYKLTPADVWVIYDELDQPFGRLRIRTGGSAGGHNGVRSTIQHIGDAFVRVRVGISLNDRTREPSEVYVLKPFNPTEREQLPQLIANAAGVITRQLTQETPSDTTFELS